VLHFTKPTKIEHSQHNSPSSIDGKMPKFITSGPRRKRKNEWPSNQGEGGAKKQCQNDGKMIKCNDALYAATNSKHCPSEYLIQMLIDAGLCFIDTEALPSTPPAKKLILTEQLQGILGLVETTSCTEGGLRDKLYQGEAPICRPVTTFVVTVEMADGNVLKVRLDEEYRRVADLKAEVERKVSVPQREQELYWCKDEGSDFETEEEAECDVRVGERTIFDRACTLLLIRNEERPNRPRFMVALFAELRRVLTAEKYMELKAMVTIMKNSNRQDKVRELLLQIRCVVGRDAMRSAITKAKSELKARKAQLKRYEALLLHIVEGGTPATSTDAVACRNLVRLLEYYRAHGGKEGAHLDQQVNAMRTIIDNAEDLRVQELRQLPVYACC
jgi:hypothetical protein